MIVYHQSNGTTIVVVYHQSNGTTVVIVYYQSNGTTIVVVYHQANNNRLGPEIGCRDNPELCHIKKKYLLIQSLMYKLLVLSVLHI